MRMLLLAAIPSLIVSPASANELVAAGQPASIAKASLRALPARDWNKLKANPGRNAETWTEDGELLNDLSFYGAIEDGQPLFRQVDKKRRPLPPFKRSMLIIDLPTLLEGSYRIARDVGTFELMESAPVTFGGHKGVGFRYSFIGADELRREGEARAAIVNGKLYMVTFEAPTLYYFKAYLDASRQVMDSIAIMN